MAAPMGLPPVSSIGDDRAIGGSGARRAQPEVAARASAQEPARAPGQPSGATTVGALLQLQRLAGNRALGRVVVQRMRAEEIVVNRSYVYRQSETGEERVGTLTHVIPQAGFPTAYVFEGDGPGLAEGPGNVLRPHTATRSQGRSGPPRGSSSNSSSNSSSSSSANNDNSSSNSSSSSSNDDDGRRRRSTTTTTTTTTTTPLATNSNSSNNNSNSSDRGGRTRGGGPSGPGRGGGPPDRGRVRGPGDARGGTRGGAGGRGQHAGKAAEPVWRPGHLNPYRSGLGAADTVAALYEGSTLVPRQAGLDMGKIDTKAGRRDREIKAYNDDNDKPALAELDALDRARTKLSAAPKFDTQRDAELEEQMEKRWAALDAKRETDRAPLTAKQGELRRQVLWLSQDDRDDRDPDVRAAQIEKLFAMSEDPRFLRSYQLAQRDEPQIDADAEPPSDDPGAFQPHHTAHHSEQRLIVSAQWLAVIGRLVDAVLSTAEDADWDTATELAAELGKSDVKVALNRSSCVVCNAFLVAELLRIWDLLAAKLGLSAEQVRKHFPTKLTFTVTYSIGYTDSLDVIHQLNQQLRLAGWTVLQHETTEGSDDEKEHESLAARMSTAREGGGTRPATGGTERQGTKKKRQRQPRDEDVDWKQQPKVKRRRRNSTRGGRGDGKRGRRGSERGRGNSKRGRK